MLFYLILINIVLASEINCDVVATSKDFFNCTLKKHPRPEIAKLQIKAAEANIEKASQFKNPELSLKSVAGSQAGENVGSTELVLAIPLSQAWTRGPQIEVAGVEKKIAEIENLQLVTNIKKDLMRDLYRLRQIDDEFEIINETIETYSAIRKQLSSRRVRGPEQEITLSLVTLATSDYLLKKNHLQVEKLEIQSKFKAIWGTSFEIKPGFLPPIRKNWPSIPSKSSATQNLAIQKSLAEADRSLAEVKLADRETIPGISLGPVIERTTTGIAQNYSFGLQFSMTLPVFSINGGSRRLAEIKHDQAKLQTNYETKKFEFDRDILEKKYRSSVESLARSESREEFSKKHQRVDGYFKQGLVSGGAVIEAHRQNIEYLQSQHEHERTALETFIELVTLSGGNIEDLL